MGSHLQVVSDETERSTQKAQSNLIPEFKLQRQKGTTTQFRAEMTTAQGGLLPAICIYARRLVARTLLTGGGEDLPITERIWQQGLS